MKIVGKAKHSLALFARVMIFRSEEIVMGFLWLTFAILGSQSRMISTLESTYPILAEVFHLAWLVAGLMLLASGFNTKIAMPSWVFSGVISLGTLSLSSNPIIQSDLYSASWLLLAFISFAQSAKWYWERPHGH